MKGLSRVKALLAGRAQARRPPKAGREGTAPLPVIRPAQIHPNVRHIVERLQKRGFQALVVGGAVRDLLLGRRPKDFDVVTAAPPEQVKRLFQNARIIGRRFRLVHLEYPDMTVEVSTFRAPAERKRDGMILRDNTWGTPEEDAFRRDFTINALAFDPSAGEVIDHVGGLPDITARVIRTITPPRVSLQEDPVRMLRAARFMLRLDFALDPALDTTMRRMAPQLAKAKRHRLAEETQRFLSGGTARAIFATLEPFGLLEPLLSFRPHPWLFREEALAEPLGLLEPYLEALDDWAAAGREGVPPTVSLLGLLMSAAQPGLRDLVLNRHPARGRDAHLLRKTNGRLHGTLGTWGFLKGQVEPAMQILAAARHLMNPHQGAKETGAGHRPPPGAWEAWMLLVLLRGQLGLKAGVEKDALKAMAVLTPMRILDHGPPRGPARGGGRRGARGGPSRRAGGHNAPADPVRPRRQGRRAKKKPRRKAAASN